MYKPTCCNAVFFGMVTKGIALLCVCVCWTECGYLCVCVCLMGFSKTGLAKGKTSCSQSCVSLTRLNEQKRVTRLYFQPPQWLSQRMHSFSDPNPCCPALLHCRSACKISISAGTSCFAAQYFEEMCILLPWPSRTFQDWRWTLLFGVLFLF